MTTSLKDQGQRTQSLDTQRSFIVQAPAGSGKTELLVQRYLALLSESNSPKAVLALTFTRKAALEMKERVLNTLVLGMNSTQPSHEPYQQNQWKLGRKLYEWQVNKGWDLLKYPERLQIQTIDSFYAELTRKAPLSSRLTPTTEVLEDPTPLYQAAIQQLLAELEKGSLLSYALMRLARHLNNDAIQIEKLLIHMLAHRDQWASVVPKKGESIPRLRHTLEACLKKVCETTHQAANEAFAKCSIHNWQQTLADLVTTINSLQKVDAKDSKFPSQLWPLVCELLLTKQGEWRKTITHKGLKDHPEALQKSLKATLKKWLSHLRPYDDIRAALLKCRELPPICYTETQWELLSDLFYILNALLTILDFLFQQHNQVDYIEIALKANQLLGDTEYPTDLLLSLDYQIQHILVDEFQDTSLQQLRFLNRLTEGWQPKDGRTLFLVGDPMQSIYRFRKAEARLFRLVQENGLGTSELESLALCTNFRAVAGLVKWVNTHFLKMASLIEAESTQKSLLQTSVALDPDQNDTPNNAVKTHWLAHATIDQEADQMIAAIQSALKDNATQAPQSIAILGRTRQHLLPILFKLRAANIPYQAVDVETLADKPIIQELLALTRALTHLGDDVAWLALLRAPFCGLLLYDLHQIMQTCHAKSPSHLIWDQLNQLDHLPLQKDSKERLMHFVKAIKPAVESYGRLPLKTRVIETWHRLGGAYIHPESTQDTKDIEQFLKCVDTLQVGETLTDFEELETKLANTYTTTEGKETKGQVTLMTIHKAKGLEFDIVMLPSLHRSTRSQSHALILFDEFPAVNANHLIIAPIKASDTIEADPIYRYLRKLDTQHHQAETLRLFYVACTRAKKELHLFASLEKNEEQEITRPGMGTFLYWLWPTLAKEQKQLIEIPETVSEPLSSTRKLKRRVLNTEAIHKEQE